MEIEELHRFSDIHTHIKAGPTSICSLSPKEAIALSRTSEEQPYSIELHPWQASSLLLQEFLEACEICRDDSRFVAIGECGLDKGRGFDIQEECFRTALEKAQELQKPVIIHCVKAWEEMQNLVKAHYLMPNTYCLHAVKIPIIHGFCKNATFAKQLVNQGFYLSLGEKYHPDVPKTISADKIFWETDKILRK